VLTACPAYHSDTGPPIVEITGADTLLPSSVVDNAAANTIHTEYHPKSGKRTTVGHFKEYVAAAEPQLAGKPWWPFFKSEDDFIFSEILLEGRISKALSERLIKLIKRCSDEQGSFTISNYADIESAWDCASSKLTPVSLTIAPRCNRLM
jgi:hypothetical protein